MLYFFFSLLPKNDLGLAIRVKLLRSLPDRFKVEVSISPGTHASEAAINKQLADKERVAAALENSHLLQVQDTLVVIRMLNWLNCASQQEIKHFMS